MRKLAKTFSIMFALTSCSTGALASDAPITLGQAIALAQEASPMLKSAAAGLRAADANVTLAGLRSNPTFNVEAENVLGSGRYSGFGGGDKTYSLTVPLELGGKRNARVQVAQAERAYAGLDARSARAEVTLKTTQAVIFLVAAHRHLAIADTALELAQEASRVADERVRSGKASPIDQQRAQVMLVTAQVKREHFYRATQNAAKALARMLDMPRAPTVAAPWFDNLVAAQLTLDVDGSDGALPVAAAEAQIVTARARVDQAQRARTPDIAVSVGMRRLGDSHDTAAVLALSVPLPLFNSGKAELSRTHAELDRAEAQRSAVVNETQQAIDNAQGDVADTMATATAAEGPVLAAATEAARIARIGYSAGKFSQLDLIEAERLLTETRESAIDALAALHDARARLARLQGRTVSLYKD